MGRWVPLFDLDPYVVVCAAHDPIARWSECRPDSEGTQGVRPPWLPKVRRTPPMPFFWKTYAFM
jgi:hypothetical protein